MNRSTRWLSSVTQLTLTNHRCCLLCNFRASFQVTEKFNHILDDGLRAQARAWLRYGVDIQTADEQALAGKTVAEFKYNLAQAQKVRVEFDWELDRITTMQRGLWESDSVYREACSQYFTEEQLARIFVQTNGKCLEISEIFPNRLYAHLLFFYPICSLSENFPKLRGFICEYGAWFPKKNRGR